MGRRHRGPEYSCLHFAAEAWALLTGEDLVERLGAGLRSGSRFERLARPSSPCLVLMRRPRAPSHVGVYLRGSVAHLTERGVRLEHPDIATLGYSEVRYYR